jgi:GGDEF domain-containing protein
MSGIERINRETFTRRLTESGGSIDLTRISPEVESALSQAGLTNDKLREISGGDDVIQGPEEFEQLYQALSELDSQVGRGTPVNGTTNPDAPLDRASVLYAALQSDFSRTASAIDEPSGSGSGRVRATGVGLGSRPPRYAVEQSPNRPNPRPLTAPQVRVEREAMALRAFENARAAGFLQDVPNLGTALPADLSERFRAAFPEDAAALRTRQPTYNDLLTALAKDHDNNGTIDIRARDAIAYGVFGQPPSVTELEAATILVGTGGRGVIRESDGSRGSGFVGSEAVGTRLVDRAQRPTTARQLAQRAAERSTLGLVVENAPADQTAPNAETTRMAVLLRQGDTGRATLMRELAQEPDRVTALASVAIHGDVPTAAAAINVLNELAIGSNAELRDRATAIFQRLPDMAGVELQALQTLERLEVGRPDLAGRAAAARTHSDEVYNAVYGRGGMRRSLDGAARIYTNERKLIDTAGEVRGLLSQNEAQIRRLEVLRGTLPPNSELRGRVDGELRNLHQQRVELLNLGVDVALKLETSAWGMADDTGWIRATYNAGSRRRGLETAGALIGELRTMARTEVDAAAMSTESDPVAIARLQSRGVELERATIDNRAHVRAYGAQWRAAQGNDDYRVAVLAATRDTIRLVQSGFPSSPEVARRAAEGDTEAVAQLARDRTAELAALGLSPDDPAVQNRTTLQVIVDRAKLGDPVATVRLAAAQEQIVAAIDQATEMMRGARATPRQLEAMNTLHQIAARFDFTQPDDLSSFNLGTLNEQFDAQLAAAGLHGIVPEREINGMREVRDQTIQFTLLTDLAAGIVEPAAEPSRDQNAARQLAFDMANRDHSQAFVVVQQQVNNRTVYRVRGVPNTDAEIFRQHTMQHGRNVDNGTELPFGPVYVAHWDSRNSWVSSLDRFDAFHPDPLTQDSFRPANAGGLPVDSDYSVNLEAEIYQLMYERAQTRVGDRYRTAISALNQYGLGNAPDRQLFETRMNAVVQTLKTQQFDPPTVEIEGRGAVPRGLAQLESTLVLLGLDRETAQARAADLFAGKTTFPVVHAMIDTAWIEDVNIMDHLFSSGRGAHNRFSTRLAEINQPFQGWNDAEAGREQVFELYGEFPDLAAEFYRHSGFTNIEGFPPRMKAGAQLGSLAERAFFNDATSWQDWQETKGYLKMGGLIAAGILITVATGGIAGPQVAMAAGVVFAAGTSGYEVLQASERLGRARDAHAVDAATQRTVRYHENELTGAYGALVINLATAGLAAKFGGGQIAAQAGRLTVRSVVREAVVGTTIGFGAGALTTAVNPNVWNSGNAFGLIMHGAVVGGVGGGVGGAAGRVASHGMEGIGRRISVAFARTPQQQQFRVGMEVQVAVEGQSTPQTWRVRAIDEGRGRVTIEREGQQLTVSIRESQLLTVNEDSPAVSALRALADADPSAPRTTTTPDPPPPSGRTSGAIVDPPAAPASTSGTRPTTTRPRTGPTDPAAPEGPTAEFQARVDSDHPLLADNVRRITGPNAEAIRARALGAAERSPDIRAVIERGGPQTARVAGELGDAAFLRAFANPSGELPFGINTLIDRVPPARVNELLTMARTRPADVQALAEGMATGRNTGIIDTAIRTRPLAEAVRLARINLESPAGLGYLLSRPNGQARVLDLVRTNPENLVAQTADLQGRVFMEEGGTFLLRGSPRPTRPFPERQALNELAQRAGVDPAVLDNPTAHPREMAQLMAQARREMNPAQRQTLDRELLGRRFVDETHYEEAAAAGVDRPEHRYGQRDFEAWQRAEAIVMRAAQEGRPLTIDMLRAAHREAAVNLVATDKLGVLRSQPRDTVHQGGEGIGIQEVTPAQLRVLRENPDLNVLDLGATDGKHRVMVEYSAPQRVEARVNEILRRAESRLAAGEDPVAVAADAQREFVSVHPFFDGNGRMSRLVMDYVLARGNVAPSVVANPNLDTAVSGPAWQTEVRNGTMRPYDATMRAWNEARANTSGTGGTGGTSNNPPYRAQPAHAEADFLDWFARNARPGTPIEEARALYQNIGGSAAADSVGFYNGEGVNPSINRAAAHVRDTGDAAVVVRASLRNLGGLNNRFNHEGANTHYREFAAIFREELARGGHNVAAFRDGPDLTFVVTGRDVPQAAIDSAITRAQQRMATRVRELGIDRLDHPKHPGDPNWQGVGFSTATRRVGPSDDARGVNEALNAGVQRYDRSLGQLPAPYPTATPRAATPPPTTTVPRAPQRQPGQPAFDPLAQRETEFVRLAQQAGISEPVARARFRDTVRADVDPLTGFLREAEHAPTMQRAIDHARATGENAIYVEIDFRNLGGLTRAIGRRAADGEVRIAARMMREELAGVGADVSLIRHGGDEVSAVVVGPGVTRAQVDAALARAQARFDAYIGDRGLSGIPHPKHPNDPSRNGAGFLFSSAQAGPNESASAVFARAGAAVELIKNGGTRDGQ